MKWKKRTVLNIFSLRVRKTYSADIVQTYFSSTNVSTWKLFSTVDWFCVTVDYNIIRREKKENICTSWKRLHLDDWAGKL